MKFNRVKECRFGTMLYNKNDKYVGRSIEYYGEFSHGESEVFRQVVKPGDVVVEVGANIGAHTLQLAQLVGSEGEVHAFEPQRVIFQALCANMALNSIAHAHCYQQAVGREPGSVVVKPLDYRAVNNFGGLSMSEDGPGERVARVTLDGLDLRKCRLIKVDVEGMEREVLEGGESLIRRHRPYLYVEDDRVSKSEELIRCIDGLGYDIYSHKPPLFNPSNFLGNPDNIFSKIVSSNLLCTPKDRPVVIKGYERVTLPKEGANH